jgi:hypothetical protein
MKSGPIALAAALALALTLPAAVQATDTVTPIAGSATISEIAGKVVAINPETRLMTVRTADGTFEVMHIPPEVTRVDHIKIGNTVRVTETEAVLVDIEKGTDAGAMGAISRTAGEAKPGDKPAGTLVDKLTLYGKVEAVDRAASTITVRGPKQTLTLKVEDRELLADLAPGDGVIATYVRTITGEVTF